MAKRVKAAKPVPALKVAPEQWAARNVEMRRASELKPHPRNVKTHGVDQVDQLTASVAEFGMVKPIVVDEAGVILAGHGTTAAVRRLGDVEIPVVVVRGLTEERKLALMLADNKIGENSGWDKTALGLQLADLKAMPGIDLALLGFKPAELDRLIPKINREGLTDPDAAPPVEPVKIVSRPGDIWQLGDHLLMCGDSTNAEHVAAVCAGGRPNLMVTDPPYGVEYEPGWRNDGRIALHSGRAREQTVPNDDRADWSDAWTLFPGNVAYVWHGGLKSIEVAVSLRRCGFEIRSQIIWRKQHFIMSQGHYHWQHEPCWYVVRNGATAEWHGDRKQSSVWDIATEMGFLKLKDGAAAVGHGTQKPIDCMRRPMLNNSQPGDLVYEPFCGSGTTLIAAEMTGRRARAIELEPGYVDVAVRRWQAFAGKAATLMASGATFGEVAAVRLAPAPVAPPAPETKTAAA